MAAKEDLEVTRTELTACADDTVLAFDAIKTAIIDNGVEVAEDTSVSEYPDKINEVYEAGVKSEYDRFWDAFQENGERTAYSYAFVGSGWNDETFQPKHKLKPAQAMRMFYTSNITELDVDLSAAANIWECFSGCKALLKAGTVDTRGSSGLSDTFFSCSALTEIEKIILKEDGSSTTGGNCFSGCTSLVHVLFEGVIGSNINFQSSPLDNASITNIFEHLSTATSEKILTLNKTAVNNAFGIDVNDEASYTDEWKSLIESKSNWTISFV